MPPLKLLDQEQPAPKKETWLQERINDFLKGFQEATGRKCPMLYPQLVGILATKANNAMGGWATVSEDGQEIIPGYPEMSVWIEQREAFFQDEFAATRAGFSFNYFLKGFGTFVKFKPVKRQNVDSMVIHVCVNCGAENRALKSQWSRMPQQVACRECKKPIRTQEVLNQAQSLTNLLP